MIIIQQFQGLIEDQLLEDQGHEQMLLHYLFPEEFTSLEMAQQALQDENNYRQVSILGYLLKLGEDRASEFEVECSRLSKRDLKSTHLPQHPSAMLGIALGISELDSPSLLKWLKDDLLPLISKGERDAGLGTLLLDFARNGDNTQFISNEEYRLFGMLQKDPSGMDGDLLKKYFIKMRKQDFSPRPEHIFRTLLAVYIMDRALESCIWEPEEMNRMREETLAPAIEKAKKAASLRARLLSFAISIGGLAILIFLSYQFFKMLRQDPMAQALWDTADEVLFFIGGPLSLIFLFSRLILFLFKRKGFNWETDKINDYLLKGFLKRIHKRRGLPIPS